MQWPKTAPNSEFRIPEEVRVVLPHAATKATTSPASVVHLDTMSQCLAQAREAMADSACEG